MFDTQIPGRDELRALIASTRALVWLLLEDDQPSVLEGAQEILAVEQTSYVVAGNSGEGKVI